MFLGVLYLFIKNYIGTQGEDGDSKSALYPMVIYATDHSKATVPMMFLCCVAL